MTPDQEKKILAMLDDYERVGWLWRGIATIAKWIATIAAAAAAVAATYRFVMKP